MKIINSILVISILTLFSCTNKKAICSTPEYKMFSDRIVQQEKFEARAVSANEIISNYRSQGYLFKTPVIKFKFCINGFDNEMPSGNDHSFLCSGTKGDSLVVPVVKFGDQLIEKREIPVNSFLAVNIPVKFSVDMSEVFDAFDKQGFFVTRTGKKIFREDFKNVFIAGSVDPLSWDFDNLPNNEKLKMTERAGHIFEINVVLNPVDKSKSENNVWKLSRDISGFPGYKSDFLLENALYNLSLEEMCNAVEPDSTLRTGKEWAGVWTRDVSYSIILGMAQLQPEVSMKSLMRKVNANGRIIQDTGTGGAWPVSSDRMIWAVAAYEIYKVTGNRDWLETIYPIIKNSVDDDIKTIYDDKTGLVKGESSFLDWREQEYPRWMQPADIFNSENLGTSAVHCKALRVLSEIAGIMGDKENSGFYGNISEQIKSGINKSLWMEDKGFYGQYLYGRNSLSISPRSETLGEALCVLFDIADKERAERLISNVPSMDFGTPCFYPNISDVPPYHNDGIWPFVQSYWMWASAKAGNQENVMHSIGAIYRAAALFLTNQENFVAYSGDWFGTQINSANMLWSLSGNISIVQHLLFGIRYNLDGLAFEPFIPKELAGNRCLSNFKYRNATLNIELEGWGNKIDCFYLDGVEQKAFIPNDLNGEHNVKIKLACKDIPAKHITIVKNQYSPLTPVVTLSDGMLSWPGQKNVKNYDVLINGKVLKSISQNSFLIPEDIEGELQIISVGDNGFGSFASEPVELYKDFMNYEVEKYAQKSDNQYKDFSGDGFVEISRNVNKKIVIPVNVEKAGTYAVEWRYANGNGPINTENKCAARTLFVDGIYKGVQVFPQRGTNCWNFWGWSNPIILKLDEGTHYISLEFMPYNENMNILINQAMLDYLRVIKIVQ
jgi:hypothetical protein